MKGLQEWDMRAHERGAFPAQPHTLAMLGLQRDTTLIAAFVRALRKRIGY
ncbi:hypothetical protein C8N35_101428 [Breoghania corrubedonensis]|uniref:Uncharacterized protein n=1 Tax=Breoghania corrubedonensis TaxID=665038 RepID=A0A2T5VF72_9HYPH|nr:hypothetical protein [Breoghania corrubedonensis]PTW62386.1 hypothetical protein C8N35_101428 [Breoghania corrubedonensis]